VVFIVILPREEENDRRDDLLCPEFFTHCEVSSDSLPAMRGGHLQSNVSSIALSIAGFFGGLFTGGESVATSVTCAIVIFILGASLCILAHQ